MRALESFWYCETCMVEATSQPSPKLCARTTGQGGLLQEVVHFLPENTGVWRWSMFGSGLLTKQSSYLSSLSGHVGMTSQANLLSRAYAERRGVYQSHGIKDSYIGLVLMTHTSPSPVSTLLRYFAVPNTEGVLACFPAR